MAFENIAAAMERIRVEVLRELQHYGEHNSCITMSVVITKVLRMTGYEAAYPLSVRVSIYNQASIEWMEQYGVPTDRRAWDQMVEAGGAQAYIGFTPERLLPQNHWTGHLAVVVPNLFDTRHGLIDSTISQANKREWGINLVPVVLKVSDEFVAGAKPVLTRIGSCRVLYEAIPSDQSYNRNCHWTQLPMLDTIAARIVARLKCSSN